MKFAYSIWHKDHFDNVEQIVYDTKDIVSYYIITTWPYLERDNSPNFVSNGLENSNQIKKAIETCKGAGKLVGLQILPTPKDSRDKQPNWWQGYINFDSNSKWDLFFQQFQDILKKHLDFGESNGASFYLVGAEMVSTLSQSARWTKLFEAAKKETNYPIGYSHHFSLPLKLYYKLPLSFVVFLGWFSKKDKVYAEILSRLLNDQFSIPAEQLVEVGKNLYKAPSIHPAKPKIIKLNDYFWYVMDQEYSRNDLEIRWETLTESGVKLQFMPAVRKWLKKYTKSDSWVWLENDLNMGYTECSDDYYFMWWDVFLRKHKGLADVIVVWENPPKISRWAQNSERFQWALESDENS